MKILIDNFSFIEPLDGCKELGFRNYLLLHPFNKYYSPKTFWINY